MNTRELNWQDMRLFLAVAEGGSFSAAARELGLGQPTLSRRLAELEERLDQSLFIRQRHGCELTALGQKLLPAAQQMALWAAEAMVQIQAPDTIAGLVRITAPPAIAFIFLPPFAAELKALYPEIQLEVRGDIDTLNLARGESDISLRTRKPNHDDLICIASFFGELKVYGSRELADSLPEPVGIGDVDWICWPDDYSHLPVNQILKQELGDFKPAFTANDYSVQIGACQCGLGVMSLPECTENSAVAHGLTVIPIDLGEYAAAEMHMVVHKRQQHIPRVIKVREQLQRYCSKTWSK